MSIGTVLVIATACAGHRVASSPFSQSNVEIDITGIDVQTFDSLPRDFAQPPVADSAQSSRIRPPPLPIPFSMKGTRVEVVFTISPAGDVTRVSLTPPKDRRFTRWLIEVWVPVKFRPALRADGTPTVGYYKVRFDF